MDVLLPKENHLWVSSKPGGFDHLDFKTVPIGKLEHHEVLVKVLYSGVGLTDKVKSARCLFFVCAFSFILQFVIDGTYIFASLPATPGYEFIGEVIAGGHHVKDLNPGTKVVCLGITGGWGEYVIKHEDDLVPIDPKLLESVDYPQAVALILNYVTAFQMIHREVMWFSCGTESVYNSCDMLTFFYEGSVPQSAWESVSLYWNLRWRRFGIS